eukprot:CFRG4390T1
MYHNEITDGDAYSSRDELTSCHLIGRTMDSKKLKASFDSSRSNSPSCGANPTSPSICIAIQQAMGDPCVGVLSSTSGDKSMWEDAALGNEFNALLELERLTLVINLKVCEYESDLSDQPNSSQKPMEAKATNALKTLLDSLLSHCLAVKNNIVPLVPLAKQYDVSPKLKGNGFRSLIYVAGQCACAVIFHLRSIAKRGIHSIVVGAQSGTYESLDDYNQILEMIHQILAIALAGHNQSTNMHISSSTSRPTPNKVMKSLFFGDIIQELILIAQNMPRHHFYGHRFGFQYPKTLVKVLEVIMTAMASYSHIKDSQSAFSDFNIGNLVDSVRANVGVLTDKRERANVLSNIGMNKNITLLKSFWDLSENTPAKHAGKIFAPFVAVNRVLQVPSEEVLVTNGDGTAVKIVFPPSSESPGSFENVNVRLISYAWRDGQIFESKHIEQYEKFYAENTNRFTRAASPGLIIHFHGGGFLAQTSQSHEIYLRQWAKTVGVPILSVDYSLAPEHPYPRAVNECYHVYCWALANAHMLGSTAQKVILIGDSAGGNLTMSIALKAILDDVRQPDALMPVYPALYMREMSSPSRLMCIMDPLLPLGVLLACLESYSTQSQCKEDDVLLSPLLADDELLSQLPPVYLSAAMLDPLLDDSVILAHRLVNIGHPMEYKVFELLPHGFLSLVGHSDECKYAATYLEGWLRSIIFPDTSCESRPSIQSFTTNTNNAMRHSTTKIVLPSSSKDSSGHSEPSSMSNFFDGMVTFSESLIARIDTEVDAFSKRAFDSTDLAVGMCSSDENDTDPTMSENTNPMNVDALLTTCSLTGGPSTMANGTFTDTNTPIEQNCPTSIFDAHTHLGTSMKHDSAHDVPLNTVLNGNPLHRVTVTMSTDKDTA